MRVTIRFQSTSKVRGCTTQRCSRRRSLLALTSFFPDKNKWINKERMLWAKYFSVPIADNTPDGFPVRTLGVQRALCAISRKSPAKLPSVIEALYHSFWVDRNSKIGEPEGFIPILETALGKQGTQEVLSAVSYLVALSSTDSSSA